MASLALNLVGLALGSGAGGFGNGAFSPLGFGVGLAGMLLGGGGGKGTVVEGPRVRDFAPPASQIGIPIPKVFGKVPVVATIIWAEKIDEHKETTEEGGKGGMPQNESISYTYFAKGAVLLCEGRIKRLLEMRFNEKLVYEYNDGNEHADKNLFGKKQGTSYLTYDAATDTWISNNGHVRIRCGGQLQRPDAKEQAVKGVDKTPAYLGRATIHFDKMNVTRYGAQWPQITCLVETEGVDGATAAQWICMRAGLNPEEDIDLCELAGEELDGLKIDSGDEAGKWMDLLSTVYCADFPERDWKIVALKRGRSVGAAIPAKDLRAHDNGTKLPEWKRTRLSAQKQPYHVEVSYMDAARDRTVNTASAYREREFPSQDRVEIDLSNFVITGPKARRIAEIKLYQSDVESFQTQLALPPKWAWLACGDVVSVPVGDAVQEVLIQSGQEGLFGVVSYDVRGYDKDAYDFPLVDDNEGLPRGTVEGMDNVSYAVVETSSAFDSQNEKPMLYLAATSPEEEDYDNAVIKSYAFDDLGGGVGDPEAVELPMRATMGELQADAGAHPQWNGQGAASSLYDDTTVFTVDLIYGELENATDEALGFGANRAIVGREGIQFGVATYVGEFSGKKRYQISHLVRGLRGTENEMEHEAGDTFILLDGAVKTVNYKTSYINAPFELKAYNSDAESADDFTSIVVHPQGRNLWPYGGELIEGVRDGSNNLTISWARRSRYSEASWWTNGTSPVLGETEEAYEVDIMDGDDVVRTLTGLSTPEATYSAANQTSDGFTPGSPITVQIYQLSELTGRGHKATATI